MFSKSLHLFQRFFHLEWFEWKLKKKLISYPVQWVFSKCRHHVVHQSVCSQPMQFSKMISVSDSSSLVCMGFGNCSISLISPAVWVECKHFTTINESILMQGHLNLHLKLLALIWIFHGFRYVKQCLNYGALFHFIFYLCLLIRENGQGDQVQVIVIFSYIEVFAV